MLLIIINTKWHERSLKNFLLSYVRCRRGQSEQLETAATADEPVPLKTVSNEMISASSNGAAIGYDSSMQVLVNGHSGAANSANVSPDKTSL